VAESTPCASNWFLISAFGALSAALTPNAASAAVSEIWKHATVMAAIRDATGGRAAALTPSTVAVLAQGASRAMNLHRLLKWAAALLLIGLAAGGAGMGMWARSAQSETERPASADHDDNRYRVTMAGGATFEVVALRRFPMGWWRPDGSPLNEAPADPSGDAYSVTGGEVLQAVVVRVKNLPDDATLKWVPTYDQGCYNYLGGDESGAGVTKDGRRMTDLRAYVLAVRPHRTIGSVQIQFAAGPWKTEGTNRGRFGYTGITMIKDGHQFSFGKPRPYKGGTTITVAHNLLDVNLHIRLVAIDRHCKEHQASYYADADARTSRSFVNHLGREHPANYSSGASGEVLKMLDTEFSLPYDQIQEFRVQSRPFERAEIKDIALQPRPAGK
jgi:hypothetical protein